MPMETHRFAVDKMLGRLATWLRLIGQDATYGSHLSRRTLVRHARHEGRTILTRDRRLLREAPVPPLVLIESDHVREQLQQVVRTFGLDPFAALLTRCSRCNDPLVSVPKADVTEQVPPYVLATWEEFMRCPRCRRIYWSATHPARIHNELRGMGFQAAADPPR
jgi:uncharacterized protein with PIN domain